MKKKKRSNGASSVVWEEKADRSFRVDLGNGAYACIGNGQGQGARPYQEDSFGVSDVLAAPQKGLLAVLADGMGGLSNGKEVSSELVGNLLAWFNAPQTDCVCAEQLNGVTAELNKALSAKYSPGEEIKAGSTLVATLIRDGQLHWLCVGDSRVYLKRGDQLYQINEDHDYLNDLLADTIWKDASVAEAMADSRKDSLVSCIGNAELPRVDYSKRSLPLHNGDILLLCSDGVYNTLNAPLLNELLSSDTEQTTELILNSVLKEKVSYQDNFTWIVLAYTSNQ